MSRVLYLSHIDPRRHGGGGGVYTDSLLRLLGNEPIAADVSFLMIGPPNAGLGKRITQVLAVAAATVSSVPAKCHYAVGPRGRRALMASLRNSPYDCIVLNSVELLHLLKDLPDAVPKIVVAHNIEHRLMQQQLKRMPPWMGVARGLLNRDCEKLRRLEQEGCRAVRNVIAVSREDAEYFQGLSPRMNVHALSPSFAGRPAERRPREPLSRPLRLGYLAKMSWWPNADAATWFIDRVLRQLPPNTVKLHLFGAGSKAFGDTHPDILAHGFVDDINVVWRTCDAMICPVQSGSGVNIKFVEAVFNRMPVLATTIAARGLPEVRDEAIVYLDQAEDWVQFLCSPAAESLAARTVEPATANQFAADQQAQRFHAYIEKIIRSCPK